MGEAAAGINKAQQFCFWWRRARVLQRRVFANTRQLRGPNISLHGASVCVGTRACGYGYGRLLPFRPSVLLLGPCGKRFLFSD